MKIQISRLPQEYRDLGTLGTLSSQTTSYFLQLVTGVGSVIPQSHLAGPSHRAPALSQRYFIPYPQVVKSDQIFESICRKGEHNGKCRMNRNRKSENNSRVFLFCLLLCLKLFTEMLFFCEDEKCNTVPSRLPDLFSVSSATCKVYLKKKKKKEEKSKLKRQNYFNFFFSQLSPTSAAFPNPQFRRQ